MPTRPMELRLVIMQVAPSFLLNLDIEITKGGGRAIVKSSRI